MFTAESAEEGRTRRSSTVRIELGVYEFHLSIREHIDCDCLWTIICEDKEYCFKRLFHTHLVREGNHLVKLGFLKALWLGI